MSDRRSLDVIQIKSPCTKNWDDMSGGARSRFCAHCNKQVHNLGEMPRDAIERMACESGGNLCVRFSRDEGGKIITLDYEKGKMTRRRMLLTILASLGAGSLLGAASYVLRKPKPPPPTVYLGGI